MSDITELEEWHLDIMRKNTKAQIKKLISEFLEDMKEKDNKIDCKYRCGGKPGEPCEHCTNYKHCDDNNYPIIEKWEKRLNNG